MKRKDKIKIAIMLICYMIINYYDRCFKYINIKIFFKEYNDYLKNLLDIGYQKTRLSISTEKKNVLNNHILKLYSSFH